MNKHCKYLLIIAGVFGASGIMMASVGAHGAHEKLSTENLLDSFDKAVLYSHFNAVALVSIAILSQIFPDSNNKLRFHWAGYCIAMGGFIFQTSLYLHTLAGLSSLTAITPTGGMLMIAGWLLVGISGLLYNKN